jgi:hypothetical protein
MADLILLRDNLGKLLSSLFSLAILSGLVPFSLILAGYFR